jgi:hypothetical protein
VGVKENLYGEGWWKERVRLALPIQDYLISRSSGEREELLESFIISSDILE